MSGSVQRDDVCPWSKPDIAKGKLLWSHTLLKYVYKSCYDL